MPDADRLDRRIVPTKLIALIDTGIDINNSTVSPYLDFAYAYDAYNKKTSSQLGNSVVQDVGTHGTYVAQEMVAAIQETKAQQYAGSADVKIMPIRIADTDHGNVLDPSAIVRAVFWAADNGASVINLSSQWPLYDPRLYDSSSVHDLAYLSQAIRYAETHGAVVVTAAGNDHQSIDSTSARSFPSYADDPTYSHSSTLPTNLLVAAAVDSSGNLTSLSNWGSVHVDLGAYTLAGGETSYAAGYTSGVAGVIAELSPSLSPSGLASYLKQTTQAKSQSVGSWCVSGGVISPANAVQGLNLDSTPPTVQWLGHDQKDYIGSGAGSSGADGYQDLHFAFANIPSGKTISWIDVNGIGGGEWRYNDAYGTDKAVFARTDGSTTADLYLQPYQDENGRSYQFTLYYTDSTSASIYSGPVYARYHLPVSSGPVIMVVGQDGHDYIGSGAGSSGPNGYQDVHFIITGIPSSKTISWIDVNGVGGGEWRFNGAYGSDKAVLFRTTGSTIADLYLEPYQNETGRSFQFTIYYSDSTSVTIYSPLVYALVNKPV